MKGTRSLETILLTIASVSAAAAIYNPRPFDPLLRERAEKSTGYGNPLRVDLGYSIYEGYLNETTGLNVFKGIRFAAPPTGQFRWQPPQTPKIDRANVINATQYSAQCHQQPYNNGVPGAASPYIQEGGSEDCLFLNLYAPQNASSLPVLVYIHGGGYVFGNGRYDFSSMINANNNGFIGIAIQYRLGSFGFLSSDEVMRFGAVNAGLLDQHFALQWVQSYIHLFGGNASAVTIAGESAGGGSVMLHAVAFGGRLGNSLFSNAITASPKLGFQYDASAWVPSQSYYAFAIAAGCFPGYAVGSPAVSQTIFQCLVNSDSSTLVSAGANVSASGRIGSGAWAPVTDGTFLPEATSQLLLKKQVNGVRMLAGNNANEGPLFTPQNITTEDALVAWLEGTFPLMALDDISKILLYYPSSNASDADTMSTKFATLGYTGPTAINQSSISTGQQQRANIIYAEFAFICPSYWLAEAYTNNGREAWKYQFSVLPGLHALDLSAYFDTGSPPVFGEEFVRQFQLIWGRFVMYTDPSIPEDKGKPGADAVADWKPFSVQNPVMLNLNQTGGHLINSTIPSLYNSYGQNLTTEFYVGPGLEPDFNLVNAYTWEGGRGYRCDFWRSVAGIVPD